MRRQDLRQPDKWRHFKKMLRRYKQDIINRLQRVDIQALALDWQVTGVDMSYWQGEIVDPVKFAGMVDFVFIRAGYGNDFVDPRMEYYVQICEQYNIPYGLYWYTKPDKDFKKHADNFYVQYVLHPGDLPPTFDDEETGGKNKTDLESWLKKLYDRFNSWIGGGYEDELTYTSPGFLNKALGITNWLKRTLLMVAHWTLAGQPIIPNEWAVPGFTWKFWQWSATGKGSDYGVSSRYIDLQRYNGSKAQFFAEFGITPPTPPPPGEDEDMRYKVVKQVKKRKDHSTSSEILGVREVGEIVTPVETWGDVKYPGAYWALGQDGAWSVVQYYNPTVEYMQAFV